MAAIPRPTLKSEVNNSIYDELGERWYTASDDPVALLRAEARLKNPWVISVIADHFRNRSCSVLDIGCGAGYLSHALDRAGHRVTGIDLSSRSLEVARRFDRESRVRFVQMSAYELDHFEQESFDVVCAMDFLEHVESPSLVVRGAARVLKPGGLFFFHTFNRNLLSRLIVIKGVEWFVRNTPRNLHIHRLFIKPRELESWCLGFGLEDCRFVGIRPKVFDRAFFRLLRTGEVSEDFRFVFTSSLALGYAGFATQRKSE